MRLLTFLTEVIAFPIYALFRIQDELSGEAKWFRDTQAAFEQRDSLSDIDYAEAVFDEPELHVFALATRAAIAKTVGVSEDRISPTDSMETFWRMQWLGPDVAQIVFHMEHELDADFEMRDTVARIEQDGPQDARRFTRFLHECLLQPVNYNLR